MQGRQAVDIARNHELGRRFPVRRTQKSRSLRPSYPLPGVDCVRDEWLVRDECLPLHARLA